MRQRRLSARCWSAEGVVTCRAWPQHGGSLRRLSSACARGPQVVDVPQVLVLCQARERLGDVSKKPAPQLGCVHVLRRVQVPAVRARSISIATRALTPRTPSREGVYSTSPSAVRSSRTSAAILRNPCSPGGSGPEFSPSRACHRAAIRTAPSTHRRRPPGDRLRAPAAPTPATGPPATGQARCAQIS